MLQYDPLQSLPTEEDLPYSDGKPVDNELQIMVASLLADILTLLWRSRTNWFWGINMGVYYEPQKPAFAPDGFLSLGVERLTRTGGRLSYLTYSPPLLWTGILIHGSQKSAYYIKLPLNSRGGLLPMLSLD